MSKYPFYELFINIWILYYLQKMPITIEDIVIHTIWTVKLRETYIQGNSIKHHIKAY